MRRILGGIGLMALLGTIVVQAAPIACSEISTLAQLTVPGAGCYNEDLVFKNFAYSGGGLITADRVNATAFFTPTVSEDYQTWVFAPVAGAWTTNFTLSYDVFVCQTRADGCMDPEPDSTIRASAGSLTSIGFGSNTTTITDTESMGTLVLAANSGAQLNYQDQTMIHTSSTANISGFSIRSYEQDFLENTPEPATWSLMIGGLLAALAFRKLKRA